MSIVSLSLKKQSIKILLLEGIHQSAVDVFHHAGYTEVELIATSLTDEELIEKVKGVHFIGLRSRTQLTEKVFEAADKLVAVGCFCIGTNQVDLGAAAERGIAVFNAPYSNTRSVAELVIAEAIMLMRGIPEKSAKAHRGQWFKSANNSYEVRGKTLGIIGYGSIGTQLGVMAESMGMRVLFFDLVTKLPLGNAAQARSLSELLTQADVVSLHVPETAATKNMIAQKELLLMKQGSVLINASRGTVVDIPALVESLESKRLLGAAIDVFPTEPKSNNDEFISELRAFDNVILSPHVGGSTQEAQENIGAEVAKKLVSFSDTGTSLSSVNFPEVSLAPHGGEHRLLNIHKNIPGILTQINSVFSENGINISGQYLQTNEKVGYVVMDIHSDHSEKALKALKSIEGTIRTRLLF
jgi:D-3-phosphoglycerate dehydrogenase